MGTENCHKHRALNITIIQILGAHQKHLTNRKKENPISTAYNKQHKKTEHFVANITFCSVKHFRKFVSFSSFRIRFFSPICIRKYIKNIIETFFMALQIQQKWEIIFYAYSLFAECGWKMEAS